MGYSQAIYAGNTPTRVGGLLRVCAVAGLPFQGTRENEASSLVHSSENGHCNTVHPELVPGPLDKLRVNELSPFVVSLSNHSHQTLRQA